LLLQIKYLSNKDTIKSHLRTTVIVYFTHKDKEFTVEEIKPSIPENELPSRVLGKNEKLAETFLKFMDINEGIS